MKHGDCWESICSGCDHATSCVWQVERPTSSPAACGWCLKQGDDSVWTHAVIKPLGLGRMSGFSTSDSDFTPHWNSSFGQKVGSLAEMKALQAAHGANDMVVKGDGAERHVPRDISRRVKHHNDFREKMDSGQPFDAGNGVRVEFTEDK